MKIILGINAAYHESSACICFDGQLIAAVEQERLTGRPHGKALRVDNADELPWEAIEAVMEIAGCDWSAVDAVAYSFDPELRRLQACLGLEPPEEQFGHPVGEQLFQHSLQRAQAALAARTPAAFEFVPHHRAHAWYAFGSSPFEEAAVLVIDGIGEGASISWGRADRQRMELTDVALFPVSIGLAWEKVAVALGMSCYDACKVMALAGLRAPGSGAPVGDQLYAREGRVEVCADTFRLEHMNDFSGLEERYGLKFPIDATREPERAAFLARGLQDATEQLLVDLARDLQRQCELPVLAYGGGVALNCRANTALVKSHIFSEVYVAPATHDAGTAVGAAWDVYVRRSDRALPMQDRARIMACGPAPGAFSGAPGWVRGRDRQFEAQLARRLEQGRLVAWVHGPCEFGPRALGARSLLAGATQPEVVARVNVLKRRHAFEPLACSIRAEDAAAWFDLPQGGPDLARYMLLTVRPKAEHITALQHLLHRDGSVRLQVVDRTLQRAFHALLGAVAEISSLPMLINTSLNLRGMPMQARVGDALPMMEAMRVDVLAINGVLFDSQASTARVAA